MHTSSTLRERKCIFKRVIKELNETIDWIWNTLAFIQQDSCQKLKKSPKIVDQHAHDYNHQIVELAALSFRSLICGMQRGIEVFKIWNCNWWPKVYDGMLKKLSSNILEVTFLSLVVLSWGGTCFWTSDHLENRILSQKIINMDWYRLA